MEGFSEEIIVNNFFISSLVSYAEGFQIITLGSDGGVVDGSISGYFIRNKNEENIKDIIILQDTE